MLRSLVGSEMCIRDRRSYALELSMISWEACEGVLKCDGRTARCTKCGLGTTVARFWEFHTPQLCKEYKHRRDSRRPEPCLQTLSEDRGTRAGWRDNKRLAAGSVSYTHLTLPTKRIV
eukprot:TRINITY_DN52185_c0_g1_i1.p1 TRINITY_DN52185_c0_g1~~TRINITY_DN52185_c0_g1_i1.p1  ORF type:complete len:118 (-),score=27.04 TRINITY_DN52185_c0_g1_i1:110-463(-)